MSEKLNVKTDDYKVEDGVLTFISEKVEEITVPEGVTEISTDVFKYIRELPFDFSVPLKKINLPSTLEKIKTRAFADCENLEEVNFKSCNLIEEKAFKGCKIKNIVFPSNLELIEMNAFLKCKELESITFNSRATIGFGAFTICSNLKEANLENIKKIEHEAFLGCDLREINLSSIEKLGDEAFEDNEHLKKVIWSKTIKQIPNKTFCACRELDDVNLENVRIFGEESFSGTAFKTLDLNTKVIGTCAFFSCPNLESIKIKADLLMDFSFSECNNLKNIDLDVKTLGINVFRSGEHNQKVDSITFSPRLDNIGAGCFQFLNVDRLNLKDTAISELKKFAFQLFNVKTLILPRSAMNICEYAFDSSEIENLIILSDKFITDKWSFSGLNVKNTILLNLQNRDDIISEDDLDETLKNLGNVYCDCIWNTLPIRDFYEDIGFRQFNKILTER